jgi:hypothetical protein
MGSEVCAACEVDGVSSLRDDIVDDSALQNEAAVLRIYIMRNNTRVLTNLVMLHMNRSLTLFITRLDSVYKENMSPHLSRHRN